MYETMMGKISLYDCLEKYVYIIVYFRLSLSYMRMVKEGVRGWVFAHPWYENSYSKN